MNAPTELPIKLTSFAHGGGCGCKIAPGVLGEILKGAKGIVPPQLLVGIETSDDAAVYRLNDEQALIATTDFFMPIVDDPYDFGRIAATNAISDVYAMGGTPILALALLGMPINKLPVEVIRRIVEGRRIGLHGRRHPDRRRAHDRFDRADLRPRRARTGASEQGQAQFGRTRRRRARPRQAARRRHLLGRTEEGRARARALRAHGRQHNATEHAGTHAVRTGRGACVDRRHRLRPAGPSERDRARQRAGRARSRTRHPAAAGRRSSWLRRATSLARLAATGQAMAAM